jgi:hypothetical protein
MAESPAKIQVLVVQYWIHDLQPIRDEDMTQLDVRVRDVLKTYRN